MAALTRDERKAKRRYAYTLTGTKIIDKHLAAYLGAASAENNSTHIAAYHLAVYLVYESNAGSKSYTFIGHERTMAIAKCMHWNDERPRRITSAALCWRERQTIYR